MQPYPDTWLLTLEDLQAELKLTETQVSAQRANLVKAIVQASADVITYLNRLPLPHVRTLVYDPPRTRFLPVEADLLEVTTLTNAEGTVLTTDDYRLTPLNNSPKRVVEMTRRGCSGFQSWCGDRFATLSLTGIFGYAPHWQYAWQTVTALPVGGLDESASTLDMPDVSLFHTGDTLRLDDEYLFVRAITGGTAPAGTLTLGRAALGTTAAAHNAGASIDRFHVLDVIRTNAIEWAAFLEKSRERVGERVQVSETGMLVVNDLSPLVKEALVMHRHNPAVSAP